MGLMIGLQRPHLFSGFLMVPFVLTLFGAESAMKRVTLPDVKPVDVPISSLRVVRE